MICLCDVQRESEWACDAAAADVSQELRPGDGDLGVSANAVCVVEGLERVGASREDRQKAGREKEGPIAGKC